MFSLTRKIPELLAAARAVRRQTGKSVFSQVREMDRLRRGPGRLRAGDYFAYHVYDDARYPGRTKDDVVSWRFLELSRLNHPLWSWIADDKLVTYAVLSSFGLPVPRVLAVYDRRGRLYGSVPTLSDPTGAEVFVRSLREPAWGRTASAGSWTGIPTPGASWWGSRSRGGTRRSTWCSAPRAISPASDTSPGTSCSATAARRSWS
jgi:hypothetical protein